MKLLMLGGTVFVGRHILDAALRDGHDVTIFTRGRHDADLPLDVRRLVGDRLHDLGALETGQWDAVIDTSGYTPTAVGASAELLADRVELYLFVSSLSVYPDHSIVGLDESAELAPSWDLSLSPANTDAYGPLKAACEVELQRRFPHRYTIVRPGLVIGPGDPTNRFSYWPCRLARGGQVLAPAPRTAPVQLIDARDHARFVLDLIARRITGVFNATSTPGAIDFGGLVDSCRHPCVETEITWVSPSLLEDHRVRPWTELPVWTGTGLALRGTMSFSTNKAEQAGLHCRPLATTAADVLDWESSLGPVDPRGSQLPAIREQLLLLIAQEDGFVVSDVT